MACSSCVSRSKMTVSFLTTPRFWLTVRSRLYCQLLNKEYYSGARNGKLIYDDDTMFDILKECEEHGYSVSIHTNGNGATEQVLRVVKRLREENPTSIYRHTVEHVQLATETSWHACMN